ncbi:MAG: DUF697 domain-containing protein [Pirellulales bacterium]|nr:DUF697 domain-containing protein [Pirellulales bacterium]
MFKSFWNLLSERVLTPQVTSADSEELLRRASVALPRPVIWLLGKTQSGKTSIIRAMTGSTQAEIGSGFRPCTRTSQFYPFPNEEECFLRFLDTRGLGEVSYDPSQDLEYCQDQAHLLMVVVRAMDHALEGLLDAVRTIRRQKPDWPLLIVQTALHDGYLEGAGHPLPYPFAQQPWPATVPADLARSLASQHEQFADLHGRFVAVDFTLPEDGLSPEFYGLEELWEAIEAELPLGLQGMLRQQPGLQQELFTLHFKKARPHVIAYSLAAAAAGAVPLPVVSLPSVVAVQAKMFHTIASIYKQPLNSKVMSELGGALGVGVTAHFAVRMMGRSLLAMIPVIGTATAAVYTAAATYALGCTLCWYFAQKRNGLIPSPEMLRGFYGQELAEGRRLFKEYLQARPRSTTP